MIKRVLDLTPNLQGFIKAAGNSSRIRLGDKYPISIKKAYGIAQTIWIYPNSDYDFFTVSELIYIGTLANAFGLCCFVESRNKCAVIVVDDYNS